MKTLINKFKDLFKNKTDFDRIYILATSTAKVLPGKVRIRLKKGELYLEVSLDGDFYLTDLQVIINFPIEKMKPIHNIAKGDTILRNDCDYLGSAVPYKLWVDFEILKSKEEKSLNIILYYNYLANFPGLIEGKTAMEILI